MKLNSRIILKSLCIAFILSNFLNPIYGQRLEQKKLIPIRTIPHNNPIEVFYPGDQPTKKYYQIAILDAYRTDNESYAEVVNDLKIQAQQLGMDAIILTKLGIVERSGVDWEGYSTTIVSKEGIAYGIKYEIDFSYLLSVPKVESIYVYSDTSETYEMAGVFNYDLNNNIESYTCPKSLYEYKYRYSMNHLLYEQENWTTRETNRGDDKRTYKNGEKICLFKYDSLDRVKEVEITGKIVRNGYSTLQIQEMRLIYDEKGRLYQKQIYPNSKQENMYFVEVFRYDDFNRLKEKQLLLNFEGDLQPITKSFIVEYYSEEELKRLYPELKLRG